MPISRGVSHWPSGHSLTIIPIIPIPSVSPKSLPVSLWRRDHNSSNRDSLQCHGSRGGEAPCIHEEALVSAKAPKSTKRGLKLKPVQVERPKPSSPVSISRAAPSPPLVQPRALVGEDDDSSPYGISAAPPLAELQVPKSSSLDGLDSGLNTSEPLSSSGSAPLRERPSSENGPLISESDLVSDKSKLNPVYRMIRKKELQHKRGGWQQEWSQKGEDSPSSASSRSGDASPTGAPSGGAGTDAGLPEGSTSVIAEASMTSDKSRLNPVYRMIRKKELQYKRGGGGSQRETTDLAALRGPGPSLGDVSVKEHYGDEDVAPPEEASLDSRRYKRVSPTSPSSEEGSASSISRSDLQQDPGIKGSVRSLSTKRGVRDPEMGGAGSGPSESTSRGGGSPLLSETDANPGVSSSISSSSRMVHESEMATDQAKMNPVFRYGGMK